MITRHHVGKSLSSAVEHDGILYLSGHGAKDVSQGMEGQTREVCQRIEALLTELGSDKTLILRARCYVTDMSLKSEMNKAYTEWLGQDLPSRATIGVAALDPGMLVEIEVTALRQQAP
jgi:enamine deaminase RidA (YjgF/YER057c/UK114 family)